MAQLSKKQSGRKASSKKTHHIKGGMKNQIAKRTPVKRPVRDKAQAVKSANDNQWTSMSDLPWKTQSAIINHMADLQWQINFTQEKLNGWSNLDNGDWTFLEDMNKAAKAQLRDLTYV